MSEMTPQHRDDVLEAMDDARGSAIRYQRYAKARDKYLARARRLSEVAAMIEAKLESRDEG